MPVSCNSIRNEYELEELGLTEEVTPSPALKLADNVIKAMRMMSELKKIEASLPGLDCGICGAPSCRALADDIVRGYAEESDCVLSKIQLGGNTDWLPAPFRIKVMNEEPGEEKNNEG